jgi:hypothetical protein
MTIKADMVMNALARRSKASATFVPGTECLPRHAVDDRTSLRSASPQKRNFPIVDQRLSAKIANFDSIKVAPETDRSSKSGAHAGFFADLVEKESETGLVGCRSSADRPLLCLSSLLTGNFTGNFAESRLWEPRRLQVMAVVAGLSCEFPAQANRELFQNNREI